jgi:MgtE intracellular N domain
MMKVVVFFVASLGGGLVVGAAGRGFMMDPPAVEESVVDGAEEGGHEPEGSIIGAATSGVGSEGADHAEDEADTAGDDADTAGDEADAEGHASEPEEPNHTPGETDEATTDHDEAGDSTVSDASHEEDAGTDPGTAEETEPVATQAPFRSPQNASPSAGPDSASSERLAKIFGSMDPKAAASVLIELSDIEITEILGGLSARKAGEVIKNMPADRAATLSRAMLLSVGGGS